MSEQLTWFKSSYSQAAGECLEAALASGEPNHSGAPGIHLRDSKLGPQSPTFEIPTPAWTAFLTSVTLG